jgi:hypothetical protein
LQYGPYGSATSNKAGMGIITTSTSADICFPAVPMRSTPSASFSAGVQISDNSNANTLTSVSAINAIGSQVSISAVTTTATLTSNRPGYIRLNANTDFLGFSAEL